jgi:hypothetical protein
MGSTFRSATQSDTQGESAPAALRWRSWPLVDYARWSWLAIVGILTIAEIVVYLGGSWLLAAAAAMGLAATLWQFFVPVRYEAGALGVRRTVLGRTRYVPWHAIRAYHLRTTGVIFFQHAEPSQVDLLRSFFLPYPADADELLCALRQHLPHAVELPQ